jgi:hypothetical protein
MNIIGFPARGVREIVEAEKPIQAQHRQGGGEDREDRDDDQAGRQCRPTEHRHAKVAHAGTAHLQHRGDEVYPRHQRAYA